MKKLLLLLIFAIIGCQEKSQEKSSNMQEISVSSISGDMGCKNCGMNLKKFISTSHVIKTINNESHYFCSINCSTVASDKIKDNIKSIYAIDYGLTKYFPVEKMHYVVGSTLKGTMTSISKFAFADRNKAENFMNTFNGKEIVGYSKAFDMSLQEIQSRIKKD